MTGRLLLAMLAMVAPLLVVQLGVSFAQEQKVPDSLWSQILSARPAALPKDGEAPVCAAPSLVEDAFVSAVQSSCLQPYAKATDEAGIDDDPLNECFDVADGADALLTSGYHCRAVAEAKRVKAQELRTQLQDETAELTDGQRDELQAQSTSLIQNGDAIVARWNSLAVCALSQAATIANADKARAEAWRAFLKQHLGVDGPDNQAWDRVDNTASLTVSLFQRGSDIFDADPAALVGEAGKVDWSALAPISRRKVASQVGASFTIDDLKRIARLAKVGKDLVDQRNNCQYQEAIDGYAAFAENAATSIAEVDASLKQAEQSFYCAAQAYGFSQRSEEEQQAYLAGAYAIKDADDGVAAVLSHAQWQRLLRVRAQLDVVAQGVKGDLSDEAIAAHQAGLEAKLDIVRGFLSQAQEETYLCTEPAQQQRAEHLQQAAEALEDVGCARGEAVRLLQAKIDNAVDQNQASNCVQSVGGGAFVLLRAEGRGLVFAEDGTSSVWQGHETVVARAAKNDTSETFKDWALQQISLSSVCGPTDRPKPHAPDLWLDAPVMNIVGGPFATMAEAEKALPPSQWEETGEAGETVQSLNEGGSCRPSF